MYDMPGQIKALDIDDKHSCEDCTDDAVPATHRITGEVDSFGAEFYYLCKKHMEEFKEKRDNHVPEPETCPECGKTDVLIQYRDIDEGSCAPLREHCEKCHQKYNQRLSEECDEDEREMEYFNNVWADEHDSD